MSNNNDNIKTSIELLRDAVFLYRRGMPRLYKEMHPVLSSMHIPCILHAITICLTTIIIASCTLTGNLYDDNNGNNGNNGNNQNEPPAAPPQMTLTLNMSGNVTVGISGTGSITINWGDGSQPATHNISSNNTNFTRSGSGTRTVTISGANITRIDCSNNQVTQINVNEITSLKHLFCNNNELTELDVNNNILLEILLCNNNNITGLNLIENKAVSMVNCSFNSMQTSALNSLLTSLHNNNISGGKTVMINDNSQSASPQSKTDAINKGWDLIDN